MYLAPDDVSLLAARLKLGLPLRGLDGREIPLRGADGECLGPLEAASALVQSGASLLPADQAEDFIETIRERAERVGAAASLAGEAPAVVTARVAAVLVGGAVRASVLARGHDISPTAMNRATLSWYEAHDQRRSELLDTGVTAAFGRLSA